MAILSEADFLVYLLHLEHDTSQCYCLWSRRTNAATSTIVANTVSQSVIIADRK